MWQFFIIWWFGNLSIFILCFFIVHSQVIDYSEWTENYWITHEPFASKHSYFYVDFHQISIHQKMSKITSTKASYINFVYKKNYYSRKKENLCLPVSSMLHLNYQSNRGEFLQIILIVYNTWKGRKRMCFRDGFGNFIIWLMEHWYA